MIGSRNEKVAIVVSAYIIGFTTAFIAFGVSGDDQQAVPNADIAFTRTAPVTEVAQVISTIGKDDEGFYVEVDGYKRILSAKQSSQAASIIASVPRPGFHAAVVAESLSTNSQYVYFCEQQSEQAKDCVSYVYSLSDDSLHKVTLDGEALSPLVAGHSVLWTDESNLIINTAISEDATQPWKLTTTTNAPTVSNLDTSSMTQTEQDTVTNIEAEPEVIESIDDQPTLQ